MCRLVAFRKHSMGFRHLATPFQIWRELYVLVHTCALTTLTPSALRRWYTRNAASVWQGDAPSLDSVLATAASFQVDHATIGTTAQVRCRKPIWKGRLNASIMCCHSYELHAIPCAGTGSDPDMQPGPEHRHRDAVPADVQVHEQAVQHLKPGQAIRSCRAAMRHTACRLCARSTAAEAADS